uniref:Na_Ca_ex domain-containing protein n=1 Tax=Angiostrongylus cantonensis TaxID=6313 RepID=A0A0K0DPM8_ANGCA
MLSQIREAMSVNAGEASNATLCDCILHGIAFPWKFIFCFVPPPTILGGWLCFIVGLALIGLLTAIVGDLASIFGCMVGLKDAVTAITLVALGTSLPDTFASKIAAQNDDSADNAVGNVTGSNSVNVFLGLGLPWLIAAIYWASKGESFNVPAADLGFRKNSKISVLLALFEDCAKAPCSNQACLISVMKLGTVAFTLLHPDEKRLNGTMSNLVITRTDTLPLEEIFTVNCKVGIIRVYDDNLFMQFNFSVTVFMCCSVMFLAILMLRRTSKLFGQAELGGPFGPKAVSGFFFVLLWIVYISLSIWNTYRN